LGSDRLSDPRGLSQWLVEEGLIETPEEVSEGDFRLGVEVRDSLRRAVVSNHGAASNHGTPLDPGAVGVLNHAAAAAGVHLSFEPDRAGMEPSARGVLGGLGRLLSFVADAMNDGTWSRLKICMNDECAWAFYDRARNRSGKWCDMAVCGNRMKARAYRARRMEGQL
jgi:predicted RNA-binding Zn ribbon-like protein